jgi:serine protease AprX
MHADLDFGPHVVQNVEAATNLRAWSDLLPVTYVENVENTDATGGHGTHVAGIAGGTGARSGGKYEGVAPGAPLVGYGSGAGLAILDVIGGFDYAIAKKDVYGLRVITNSWGDSGDACTPVNPNDPVTRSTKNAYNAGLVVVFSAGNSGPDECTISGNYKKAPWVISVAATNKQKVLASFSSRGTPGGGGTITIDGETWTWQDQPTLPLRASTSSRRARSHSSA